MKELSLNAGSTNDASHTTQKASNTESENVKVIFKICIL